MSMQVDLRALLLASPVAALVGNRIVWNVRAQGSALPALLLTIVGDVPLYAYGGPVALYQNRVQFDIWAADYPTAIPIDAALMTALSGYRGTQGSTEFQGILFVSRFDGAEDTGVAAQQVSRISRDAMVNWKET